MLAQVIFAIHEKDNTALCHTSINAIDCSEQVEVESSAPLCSNMISTPRQNQ